MEAGRIVISRAASQAEFPARFQLVAAMNPCPCGYAGDRNGRCHCTADQIQRYRGKISGPLLDRIDLFVEVTRPRKVVIPGNGGRGEPSSEVRKRAITAHRVQIDRQGTCNGQLETSGVRKHCRLSAAGEKFLETAAEQLSLSPRSCQRVLKVARTIADLENAEGITRDHLAEAIGFRQPARSPVNNLRS
jgi:magnesium chelatase family protein